MRFSKNDRNKFIYLAGPYTHDCKHIEEDRYRALLYVGSWLWYRKGVKTFNPILQSYWMSKCGFSGGGTWTEWKDYDLTAIDKCDEVWVLSDPGWKESVGVTDELEYARAQGKPIMVLKWDRVKNIVKKMKG